MGKKQQLDDFSDVPSEELRDSIKLFLSILASRGIDHGLTTVDYHHRVINEMDQITKAEAPMLAAIIRIDGVPMYRDSGKAVAYEEYKVELDQAYEKFIALISTCQYFTNAGDTENKKNAEKRRDALSRTHSDDPAIAHEAYIELAQLAAEKDPHLPTILNANMIGEQADNADIQARLDEAAEQAIRQREQQHREVSIKEETRAQWEVEKRIVAAVIDLQNNPRWKMQINATTEYFRRLEERKNVKKPIPGGLKPLSQAELEEYWCLKKEDDQGRRSLSQWISRMIMKWGNEMSHPPI